MVYDRQTTNQQQPPCLVIDLLQPLHSRLSLTKQLVCDPATVWRDRTEPVCLRVSLWPMSCWSRIYSSWPSVWGWIKIRQGTLKRGRLEFTPNSLLALWTPAFVIQHLSCHFCNEPGIWEHHWRSSCFSSFSDWMISEWYKGFLEVQIRFLAGRNSVSADV